MTVFYNLSADRELITKHNRPVSRSAPDLISVEKMSTETMSKSGSVMIILKGPSKVPFLARGFLGTWFGRSEPCPPECRQPSTLNLKLSHIKICRSGTI